MLVFFQKLRIQLKILFWTILLSFLQYAKVLITFGLNKNLIFFKAQSQGMKNFQSNYDIESRASTLNRSRSQNYYYIQANQFQRRYRNSLMSAYRQQRAKNFSPCCSTERSKQNERKMKSNENEKVQHDNNFGQYYQTSYFIQNSAQQTANYLQKSKHFLSGIVQKPNFHLKIHKDRTYNQIKTLQKLIETKDKEIQQLNKQITWFRKRSLEEALPNGSSISYIEIQNKDQTMKELERKINQLRQQNSYFRQDMEIKNRQIEQERSKFKMKQDNDFNLKKQLEKQNTQLKQEIESLEERINQLERQKKQKQVHINCNMEKLKTLENQFIVLQQKTNQKDLQIQQLLSKITSIQSDLYFFKHKFTNLVFEIERQERQSTAIYEYALFLQQEGLRFYDSTLRIKESEANWFDDVQNQLEQRIPMMKETIGKYTTIYSPSVKNIASYDDYGSFFESRHEIINKFTGYT